jgi:folate-binding protein YgfZ
MGPLAQFAILNITGADAAEFLHSQLSSNVLSLEEGQSRPAAYCDANGRVLAVLLVHRVSGGFYVLLDASLESDICKRLKIYVLRSEVSIVSLRKSHAVYGVRISGDAPQGVWPYPMDKSRGLILLGADEVPPSALDLIDPQKWLLADIESRLAWLDTAVTGRFLPQALGLLQLGAVDFDKGCYPGQEIIARVHYLGAVKRELVQLSVPGIEQEVVPGQVLYWQSADDQENKAGDVVAAAPNKDGYNILSIVNTDSYNINLNYYIR